MKIHNEIPASFKLMDLANAGVATKLIMPTINPATAAFFASNIANSPFLSVSYSDIAFNVPGNKLSPVVF
jgi:hypothetical protein